MIYRRFLAVLFWIIQSCSDGSSGSSEAPNEEIEGQEKPFADWKWPDRVGFLEIGTAVPESDRAAVEKMLKEWPSTLEPTFKFLAAPVLASLPSQWPYHREHKDFYKDVGKLVSKGLAFPCREAQNPWSLLVSRTWAEGLREHAALLGGDSLIQAYSQRKENVKVIEDVPLHSLPWRSGWIGENMQGMTTFGHHGQIWLGLTVVRGRLGEPTVSPRFDRRSAVKMDSLKRVVLAAVEEDWRLTWDADPWWTSRSDVEVSLGESASQVWRFQGQSSLESQDSLEIEERLSLPDANTLRVSVEGKTRGKDAFSFKVGFELTHNGVGGCEVNNASISGSAEDMDRWIQSFRQKICMKKGCMGFTD